MKKRMKCIFHEEKTPSLIIDFEKSIYHCLSCNKHGTLDEWREAMREKGLVSDLSEQEIIKTALDHLAESLCWVYETKSPEGHALAFMVDSAVKYGQVIMRGDDVLLASADYTEYENEISRKHQESKL